MIDWIFGSKIEEFLNEEWIGIHTRAPLTTNPKGYYSSGLSDNLDKNLTILTAALVRGLENLPGIKEVSCQRHRISIRRGMAYTWEELLEKMTPLFVSYLPANL